jgi:hypothetical protein
MYKRWLKIAAVILLILLASPFVFLLCEHARGRVCLALYRHSLVAKGEKLTAHELAGSPPQGENGAPEVIQTQKELKAGVVLPNHHPPTMRITPAGRAVVCFREEEWSEDKVTYEWDQMAEDLKTNAVTLGRIRLALQKPVLDNRLDFTQGPRMLIPHLAPAKALTFWFGAESQLALYEGRTREALPALLSVIQLPRLMAEDHVLISELVRIAIAAIARTDTWEALQADGWTDEDLLRVQQACTSQSFADAMVRALQGEVVYCSSSFDCFRKSNEEAVALLDSMHLFELADQADWPWWQEALQNLPGGEALLDFLKKQVYCRLWRFAWVDQCERRYLEDAQRLLEIARIATTNKSFFAVGQMIDRLRDGSTSRNFYDRLRNPAPDVFSSLPSVVSKAMRAETERSLVICAVALKRYTLRHGSPPPSLDALVPEFLPAVPMDYMDGKPIKYRLGAGGAFTLYSVGENGRDDGGDTVMLPEKTNRRNLWDRKDYVWPAPALPDEILAYRKAALSQ